MLLLLSLWLGSAAHAEPPAVPDPDAPGASGDESFSATLEEAKQHYFQGESGAARELLQGLQLRVFAGESLDWALVSDALIYLGEIYCNEGDQEQAEVVFRYLLEHDPNTPISAFHHPAEVVSLFEVVRSTVLKSRSVPPPPPPSTVIPSAPPVPAWVFLPLGVPQFGQKRPAAGFAYATLQAGFATASIALRIHIANGNTIDFPHPLNWDPDTVTERVQRERYLFQWPATFAFYLTWGVSTVDGIRWHQRHPPPVPTLSATPDGTPTIGIAGRF